MEYNKERFADLRKKQFEFVEKELVEWIYFLAMIFPASQSQSDEENELFFDFYSISNFIYSLIMKICSLRLFEFSIKENRPPSTARQPLG